MANYQISKETAHQIAVGLYRQAGEFIAAAKRDSPEDYEHFKAAYLSKQAAQTPAPAERNYTLKNRAASR